MANTGGVLAGGVGLLTEAVLLGAALTAAEEMKPRKKKEERTMEQPKKEQGLFPLVPIKESKAGVLDLEPVIDSDPRNEARTEGVFDLEKKVDREPLYVPRQEGLADLLKPPQEGGIQQFGRQGGFRRPQAQELGADALVNQPSQIDGFEELKRKQRLATA